MVRRTFTLFSTVLSLSCVLLAVQLHSQPPADGPRNQSEGFPGGSGGGFPGGGPGGFLSGPGFPGGPGGSEVKILEKYDANKDGWLNTEERTEAKKYLAENPVRRGGPRGGQGGPPGGGAPGEFGPPGFGPPGFGPPGFAPPGEFPGGAGGFPGGPGGFPGGPGGMGRNRPAPEKGMTIAKSSVEPLTGNLYDNELLRTVFIDFEIDEWEKELETFHGTDVDVAATLTVDGQQLPNCGIHFRGMSSYSMVPAGYKRSLNVSVDMANSKQRLLGYKTLNLLNCNADSTMLSSVLYSKIAGQHIPTPKANLVRVVINGEDWGIHANVQQFNKEFLKEHFESSKGTRWKVSGSPMGGGGLDYRGDDPAAYQRPYEIKNDDKDAVTKLINLCRVLAQTPTEDLPAALEPIVDVEGLLWFLALDNALINSDGYWIRASDYSIFLDEHDKFHFVPHDMNESFRKPGGPGMGGPGMGGPGMGGPGMGGPGMGGPGMGGRGGRGQAGPGGQGGQMAPGGRGGPGGGMAMINGVELDPLIGLDDASKPLRSKVLAVPKYREQYLKNVREIAEKDLDWKTLGPFVESQVEMIDPIVKTETRMLSTYQEFVASTKPTAAKTNPEAAQRGGHGSMNLYEFAEARRKYLLRVTK